MLEGVIKHYETRLAQHGATALGVDWNSEAGQDERFAQLLAPVAVNSSINDLGCGYGKLARARSDYVGYDISPKMIAQATVLHPDRLFVLGGADALRLADWTLASGLFNVKLDAKITEWEEYVLRTLKQMCAKSRIGIGFNMLSDLATQRKPRLYYGNIEQYALWALHQGFKVTTHQDVKHEFTMIVRKD